MSDLISEISENFSMPKTQSDIEEEQCSSLENQNISVQYTSRLENLQKIFQKKQTVLALPQEKKLLKLAVYSKCQVEYSLFRCRIS